MTVLWLAAKWMAVMLAGFVVLYLYNEYVDRWPLLPLALLVLLIAMGLFS